VILADTAHTKALLNERMAYVAISRAASEVRIYTDSAVELAEKFSRHSSKTQTLDFARGEEKQHFLGLGASG